MTALTCQAKTADGGKCQHPASVTRNSVWMCRTHLACWNMWASVSEEAATDRVLHGRRGMDPRWFGVMQEQYLGGVA